MLRGRGWQKLASIYIGTIIGAGFASGQEIIQFFGVFGYKGLIGVILATVLFSLIGEVVLINVYRNQINGYQEFVKSLFGRELGKVLEIIITLFLFISFCIMLSGSGAIFNQQFKLSYSLGIYIMAVFTLVTFLYSIKGISTVNTLLVPILLLGIVTIGIIVIFKNGFIFSNYNGARLTKTGNWLTSSILYVSYNSISAVVIMTSLFPIIPSERSAIKGGLMGGIGLGILSLFILLPTLILYTDIYSVEIPMLKVADQIGYEIRIVYSLILWCAMFTTAIANGFGCIRRFSLVVKLNEKLISIIFLMVAIPFANIGFSNLVSTLYPLFGYLGFFMLIIIIGNFIVNRYLY